MLTSKQTLEINVYHSSYYCYWENTNNQLSISQTQMEGMDDLLFYILFTSISVISGPCLDDNKRLCAIELDVYLGKISPRVEIELGPLNQ